MLCIIERLAKFRSTQHNCNAQQSKGFKHKFTMLAVDALRNMLRNGMNAKEIIEKCDERLVPLGIYPLPQAKYSTKYRIFCSLANSKRGMKILCMFTPSKKTFQE